MAATSPNTILLNGDPQSEKRQFEDYQISSTGSAIAPGFLVEVNPANAKLRAHATAGGIHGGMFALENPFADTTGSAIAYSWSTGSTPKYVVGRPGDEIYAYLKANVTIDEGDWMESAGDGSLTEHVADTASGTASITVVAHQIVAWAREDITSTTGAMQRIKVRLV